MIGESGQVLVLDMGEPMRIVDLTRDLIRLSRHALDEIAIVFSRSRPRERLFEDLLADADGTLPTGIARLRVARLSELQGPVYALLDWARNLRPGGGPAADALARVATEYRQQGR